MTTSDEKKMDSKDWAIVVLSVLAIINLCLTVGARIDRARSEAYVERLISERDSKDAELRMRYEAVGSCCKSGATYVECATAFGVAGKP